MSSHDHTGGPDEPYDGSYTEDRYLLTLYLLALNELSAFPSDEMSEVFDIIVLTLRGLSEREAASGAGCGRGRVRIVMPKSIRSLQDIT